jgi:hypothetical protein
VPADPGAWLNGTAELFQIADEVNLVGRSTGSAGVLLVSMSMKAITESASHLDSRWFG